MHQLTMTRVQQQSGTLSTACGDEVILVNSLNGRFYSLSETGALVWNALARPRALCDVIDYVLASRSALPAGAGDEIAAFVAELQREGLVTAAAEGEAAPLAAPVAEVLAPYGAPRLHRGSLRDAANGGFAAADGSASQAVS